MSGGAGGRRRDAGSGDTEVITGQAKETLRQRFEADGHPVAQRQGGWRETDDFAAFGGRSLRNGSAACTS
jgi:hypothetical protein